MGTSQGPGARRWEMFAPKAEQQAAVVGRRALAWKQKTWGFRSQCCHASLCDPGNSPDPVSGRQGQTGASVSGGERAVSSPLPHHGCLRILDVGEAAGPSSLAAAACLSPWQPGQKTNLPGSRLCRLPWSWVLTCLSGSRSTATPRSL